MRVNIATFLCAAAIAATIAAPALADEESPALAKYAKPVDQAVDKALEYLAKQQEPDGSFKCPTKGNTAVTSLSVMAFLAKGNTPQAGPYADVINKGIDFILNSQNDTGMLIGGHGSLGPMYCHCISTLMLSEASGMVDKTRKEKLDKVLAKALKVILTAQQIQKPAVYQGGWRYAANSTDADISCSGWALMALRSARNNGAQVPKEAIDMAVKFIMACRAKDGGFCYQPGGGPGAARTGVALLCLELCGKHKDPAAIGAGDWILKYMPKQYGESFFYYALYYSSQGMFQLGGKYWETYAANMYDIMLKFQQPDGSWPQGSSNEAAAGTCYSTAIGVLSMSVTYRQLPIYQR